MSVSGYLTRIIPAAVLNGMPADETFGFWLIHDTDGAEIEMGADYALADLTVDKVLWKVLWTGQIMTDSFRHRANAFNMRFLFRRVTDSEAEQLILMAHHGVFRRHAIRIWEATP